MSENKFISDRKNPFTANDWFDINFFEKFLYSDLKIIAHINQQTYTIGEEKLSSRVLNHWYQEGIIIDDRPNKKGWKKFSFSEIVWMQIVMKLRKFGLDLKRIKTVKQQIDIYNTEKSQSKCPLLDFYILVATTSNIPIKFIVFESGQAEIVKQTDIDLSNQLDFINEDFISIDINRLLNKIITKKRVKADYFNYNKTEIEKEIFNSLYLDKDKSITIKLNNGKDFLVTKDKILSSKKEMESLLNKLEYAEGSIIKRGKKKYHKVEEKKRIKK
jgi:DNA-binding transcriptional MerR regulator